MWRKDDNVTIIILDFLNCSIEITISLQIFSISYRI